MILALCRLEIALSLRASNTELPPRSSLTLPFTYRRGLAPGSLATLDFERMITSSTSSDGPATIGNVNAVAADADIVWLLFGAVLVFSG